MRRFPVIPKFLSFVVMALLLVLPLASLTADSVFTSCDKTSLEVSLQANGDGNTEDYLLRSESELSFNVDLFPAGEMRFPGEKLQSSVKPAPDILSLKDIICKIFIPPQFTS